MKGISVVIEPVAVGFETAGEMLGVGKTKAWELAKAGKLDTIKIGADSKVVVESIRRFVASELAAQKCVRS
jgi:hypothetical protein